MNTGANSLDMVDAVDTATSPGLLFPWIVGFFFSFRLYSVVLAVRVLQQDADAGVVLSLGLNFLLLGAALFQAMGAAPRTIGSLLRAPSCRWVLFFLGFSGCSLMWSATASLPAAAAFWGAMVADAAIVLLLLRTGPVEDVSAALMRGYVLGACGVAAIAWIMPAASDLRLGDEELLGTNQIGYACAFAIFLAQYLMKSNKGRWGWVIAFLSLTLLRSLSKTTLIAFVVSQSVLLLWDRSVGWRTKILVILASVAVVAIFWGLLDSYYEVYTSSKQGSETLTGRFGIWLLILDKAIEQPWIGHGFHSVWKVIPPFGDFEARHAHNELLQQFYAYGVVGVVMLVGLYLSFFRQVKRLVGSPVKMLLFALLLFVLIRGVADTETFDLSLPLWSILLFSVSMAQSQG